MIKAVVTGAAGRMGSRIINLISAAEGIEIAGAVERKGHSTIGRDVGESLDPGKTSVIIEDNIEKCIHNADVIIDFTNHEASIDHLKTAAENNISIVIGSTGFTTDEMKRINDLSTNTRCVFAPNMSVGVNVMFKVLEYVAGILGDEFDVEIIEAHHNLKKDAPSGTAVKMARIIAGSLGRDLDQVGVYGRKGMVGTRPKNEIGIQTVRAGDITGEHTVIFGGIGERLEFIHRAHNRDNFARGAIRAAKWIVNQEKEFTTCRMCWG
jgi:dihydrodipicolinate reductase